MHMAKNIVSARARSRAGDVDGISLPRWDYPALEDATRSFAPPTHLRDGLRLVYAYRGGCNHSKRCRHLRTSFNGETVLDVQGQTRSKSQDVLSKESWASVSFARYPKDYEGSRGSRPPISSQTSMGTHLNSPPP